MAGSRGRGADVGSVWREMPDLGVFLCLGAAWVALFHFLGNSTLGYVNTRSLFGWWTWVYTRGAWDAEGRLEISKVLSGEEAHAWFIPIVVLALLWWRRDELLALPKKVWWPALLIFIGGIVLHVAGYLVQQTRISIVAFVVGLYGLTGLLWGWRWLRATLFPFSLFAFCVPLGNTAESITFPLRLFATDVTAILCRSVLGINVIQDGTLLSSPTGAYQYEVAAACGGIRSLTAILALTVIFGFLAFKTNWRRIVMVISAFPLAVLGNVFRLTLIVIASEAFGREAGHFVHENFFFSLAPYVPSLAGTLLLGHWLREDRAPKKEQESVLLASAEEKA